MHYADRVKREYPGYDVRVSILGHLQRGGAPSANDRILASRLGEAAIQALMEDQHNIMVGIHNNEIVYVPFDQAIKNDKPIEMCIRDSAQAIGGRDRTRMCHRRIYGQT